MLPPRKTLKGPKPNPLIQYNRVRKNGEAQNERINKRKRQQHGREGEIEFTEEEARFINAVSGHERDERVQSTSRARLEKSRQNETSISPTHTDYSTNSESEEPVPPPKKSFREEYKNQPNVKKTNSEIFRVTRKALENRSGKRNEASKSRSQKRAKTQSAPGLLEQFENLIGNVLHKVTKFTKLKGT